MNQFIKSEYCKHCSECNERTPIFNVLDEEGLYILNENRNEVKFKAGENILKQGMPANHLISVTSGLVKIYVEGVNDRNLILELIKPWNVFGCPGFYSDNRHHYSAAAIEDTSACFIDLKNIKTLIRTKPDFAEEFVKLFSRKHIQTFERFVSLTQKQMPGRMADAILYLSSEIYGSTKFNMSISRQDIADLTNMTKDSVLRILKDFHQNNVISMHNGTLEILNPAKLQEYSLRG